jgi:ubiquinone/menaquinone biosynthesis C-methylase UbiE
MTDYDRTEIPAGYDRGRDHGPEMLAQWMDAIASHLHQAPRRILDLGCGTGRFSDALAVRFGVDVMGVDPSFRMIARAVRKPRDGRVYYQLGRAEALPIRSRSIDLVFMSMSLHHFADARLAAAECRRALDDRGYVFVRTGTRERIPSYPYYPFFPASHPILEEVLPTSATVRDIFEAAGLSLVALDLISQTVAPDWDIYADKIAANADSVLARLTREDFAEGLAAVRQHAVVAQPHAVVEPIDLFVFSA